MPVRLFKKAMFDYIVALSTTVRYRDCVARRTSHIRKISSQIHLVFIVTSRQPGNSLDLSIEVYTSMICRLGNTTVLCFSVNTQYIL